MYKHISCFLDTKDFFNKSIILGYIQQFRKLLGQAVYTVFGEKAGHLRTLIDMMHQHYPPTLVDGGSFKVFAFHFSI